jgi:hypothetical protein
MGPDFFKIHITVEGWEMSELGVILALECGILGVPIFVAFALVQTE